MSSQLTELSRPFPPGMIHKKPGSKFSGDYVEHSSICQRLLQVVGPFDFELVQTISEPDGRLSGVVCRLICEIDGRTTVVEEAGDVENLDNLQNNGARLKHAMSDAIKRCAARIGLGLHLWAQDEFFLHDRLVKRDEELAAQEAEDVPPT